MHELFRARLRYMTRDELYNELYRLYGYLSDGVRRRDAEIDEFTEKIRMILHELQEE